MSYVIIVDLFLERLDIGMGDDEGVLRFFTDRLETGRELFRHTLAVDEVDALGGQLTTGSQHRSGVIHKTYVTPLLVVPVAGTVNLMFAVLGFAVMLVQLHERQQLGGVCLVRHNEDAVILLLIAKQGDSVEGSQRVKPDNLNQGVEFFRALLFTNLFENRGADLRRPESVQVQMCHELGVLGDVGLIDFSRLAGGQCQGQAQQCE